MNDREKRVWDSAYSAAYVFHRTFRGVEPKLAFEYASDIADEAVTELRFAQRRQPAYGEIV
jgi:hypothetical protein